MTVSLLVRGLATGIIGPYRTLECLKRREAGFREFAVDPQLTREQQSILRISGH